MAKSLSEMTLQELWELFPIILSPHNPDWNDWYLEQETALRSVLPQGCRIHHIGSTAIPSIWAKPIVDILAELPASFPIQDILSPLQQAGWICMSKSDTRLSFNRGYTPQGFAEKVFHLHIRYSGDHDELYFRDYMLQHPAAAKEYEALKFSLWHRFEHDRDAYTAAKADLVQTYTRLARQEFAGRYDVT